MSTTTNNYRTKFSDTGTERVVLACILMQPDLLIDASAKLNETDFLSAHHQALFAILKKLHDRGLKSFDLMSVLNEAEARGITELVGGAEYVSALVNSDSDTANFEVHLTQLLDCSYKFRLFKETESIRATIMDNAGVSDSNLPADELLAQAEGRLLDISMESRQVDDAVDVSKGLIEELELRSKTPVKVRGIPTNIPLLDYAVNGLTPGSLTVIAARQKGGKSTLMMNLAAYVAYNQGIPVMYVDTEMSLTEFQNRLVAHMSGVPERQVSNGTFINNRMYTENIHRACSVVSRGKLFHKYMPGFTVDAIKSMTRKFHARENIGALFFDYIKLPEISGNDAFKEHQILGNVTTALKDLAGRLEIPVIAAAQIKRGDSAVPKSRFHDNDVADSDRIGRYCNNLLAIAPKNRKEIEEDGATCGTHRLQVLLARAGHANHNGIDLDCDFPTLTMRQAHHQSSGFNPLSGDQDGRF